MIQVSKVTFINFSNFLTGERILYHFHFVLYIVAEFFLHSDSENSSLLLIPNVSLSKNSEESRIPELLLYT